MEKKIKSAAVIGDGGWGTALALVLHRNGFQVSIWSAFPDYADELMRTRTNRKFLPGVPIPADMKFFSDPDQFPQQATLAVLASPSRFFEDSCRKFAHVVPPACHLVSVAKGLSPDGTLRMTEVAQRAFHRPMVAALSGPSHAEEVARGIPTAIVAACGEEQVARAVQDAFSSSALRVYTSDDTAGVEIGGALKNVIAIAAGVSDGIGFGDNTKAALITRGLAEISRIGRALGAHPETFAGLSGMGDLVVTCFSRFSRNRGVGERLGKGESTASILASMEMVAEGVQTAPAALKLAARLGIQVPIVAQVNAILSEGKNPRQAVEALLARDPRPERDDP